MPILVGTDLLLDRRPKIYSVNSFTHPEHKDKGTKLIDVTEGKHSENHKNTRDSHTIDLIRKFVDSVSKKGIDVEIEPILGEVAPP